LGAPGCCLQMPVRRFGWEVQQPPPQLLSPPILLRWPRIWQKPAEAGTRYCLSVPPPFYAFLIFKAVNGPGDEILSNRILSYNLALWLSPGWKCQWGSGAAGRGRSSVGIQSMPHALSCHSHPLWRPMRSLWSRSHRVRPPAPQDDGSGKLKT
jgi:hypothetical protein